MELKAKRLLRSELRGQAYSDFVAALFDIQDTESRLRYSEWVFGDNPAWERKQDLPIYVCIDGQQIVGQLAVIPNNSMQVVAGWAVDFHVAPSHQRMGIGKLLLNAAKDDFETLMTLGQTDQSFNLFIKLGWRYNNRRLAAHSTFLKPKYFLAYLLKKVGLTKHRQKRAIKQISAGSGINSLITGMPRTRGNTQLDNEYIDWRFRQHPVFDYQVHCVNVDVDSEIVFVWRFKKDDFFHRASIVCVFYDTSLTRLDVKNGWRQLNGYLRSIGIEILECETSDKNIIAAWPRLAFSTNSLGARFLFSTDKLNSEIADSIENRAMFSSDCDLDSTFLYT